MSSGRLFQSFGPAEANERSPTVTRRDGRTSSWLEVADLATLRQTDRQTYIHTYRQIAVAETDLEV